jgi:thiosulfate dehydrogenase [quinone] large subunit
MTTMLDRLHRPSPLTAPDRSSTEQMLPRGTARYLWAFARLGLGWTFLWPFLDKTFGLHHQTASASAWIRGGSPTKDFLSGAAGPLAGFYRGFAGAGWANWGFMLGLICIAVALLLGVGMRIAAVSGSVLLVLMWSASFPPSDDLFLDNDIIYAVVLLGLAVVGAGSTLGLGRWWTSTTLVRHHPWLT